MPLPTLINRFSQVIAGIPAGNELEYAIAKAHTDMSRRAKGHDPAIQIESITWLKNRFITDPPFACTSTTDFDIWHTNTCNDYCTAMNNFISANHFSFHMTHGRAQKVLNMTFKYLYCSSAVWESKVNSIAPYLHMTLDGYTLRWYKEVVVNYINSTRQPNTPKLKVGDISDWSKMNEPGKHRYIDIQNRIREYLLTATAYRYTINTSIIDDGLEAENTEHSQNESSTTVNVPFDPQRKAPFFAEFVVWEGEIVRTKIDNLLKGLNSTFQNWAENKWAVNQNIEADLKTKLITLYNHI